MFHQQEQQTKKKNVSRKSIGILCENRGKSWIRLTENRTFGI